MWSWIAVAWKLSTYEHPRDGRTETVLILTLGNGRQIRLPLARPVELRRLAREAAEHAARKPGHRGNRRYERPDSRPDARVVEPS